MRNLIKMTVIQLILLLWPTPQSFAANLKDPRFLSEARGGFAQIYNLDYDDAMETFALLHSEYPQHPAPPLYMATTVWLRELLQRDDLDLNKFVTATYFDGPQKRDASYETRQRFAAFIAESRSLAEHALEENPDDNDALYFLASTYGVQAGFAITVEHSKVQAFELGKKSYQLHRELVSRNPQYYDSYMTLGMYEYIAGNLPWYVKWLARVAGYGGSVQRGLQYLQLSAERGQFAADDARVMLMVLDARDRHYSNALEIEAYLQSKYPRSFVLSVTRAQILERMGSRAAAASVYQEIIARSDAGVAHYDRLRSGQARYALGRKLMELERCDLAVIQFRTAVEDPGMPAREQAITWLAAGEALDILGRRAEAVSDYRVVLSLPDVDGSQSHARDYIGRPYRETTRD